MSPAELRPHIPLMWHLFNDKDLSKDLPPDGLILTSRQWHPPRISNINLCENFLLSQFLFVPWMGCHAAGCW